MKPRTFLLTLLAAGLLVYLPGCKDLKKYKEMAEQAQNAQNPLGNVNVHDSNVQINDDGSVTIKRNNPSQEADTRDEAAEKLAKAQTDSWNTYVRFCGRYNKWGTPAASLAKYKKHKYGSFKKPPKDVRLEFDVKDLMLDELKKAREVSLGEKYETMEKALDELIKSIEVFKPTLVELEKHVKTREYLADKGEYLKSKDAIFIEQATAFVEAYNKFNAEMDRMDIVRSEESIAEMKKAGHARHAAVYETNLILEQIFRMCRDSKKLKDPEVQEAVTAKIDEFKKAIDNLHEENEKVQDHHSKTYKEVEEEYLKLLGDVRAFGDGFKVRDYNNLVSDYNSFVTFKLNSLAQNINREERFDEMNRRFDQMKNRN